ncbi:hypothetical protein [Alishewanella longhuensis]
MSRALLSTLAATLFSMIIPTAMAQTQLKVATFNVSMEAGNYLPRGEQGDSQVLIDILANGEHPQVRQYCRYYSAGAARYFAIERI